MDLWISLVTASWYDRISHILWSRAEVGKGLRYSPESIIGHIHLCVSPSHNSLDYFWLLRERETMSLFPPRYVRAFHLAYLPLFFESVGRGEVEMTLDSVLKVILLHVNFHLSWPCFVMGFLVNQAYRRCRGPFLFSLNLLQIRLQVKVAKVNIILIQNIWQKYWLVVVTVINTP